MQATRCKRKTKKFLMTFSLKNRQLPTTNSDHPSTSIRKGTEYILLRAKSGKNEPLPDSINQQPSQLPSQSKPFHKPAAPSQRPNPNHFKKKKRETNTVERKKTPQDCDLPSLSPSPN
jgi:hypothetical protein